MFGAEEGAKIGAQLESIFNTSPIGGQPFLPQTQSEQGFLKSISDLTQGAAATRGLGPATQGGLAQNLAPALMGLRQQDIGNQLNVRGQDIQGLLELAGLVMPQIIGGQQSNQSGKGTTVGPSSLTLGGGG